MDVLTGSLTKNESVNLDEAWRKLYWHSRRYTVLHGAPLTLWRPICGYLLTFEQGVALQRERPVGRAFTLLINEQTVWPLRPHRLCRLFNFCNAPLTVGWITTERLQQLLTTDSALAHHCIERISASSDDLTTLIAHQMQRTTLPSLARTLLTLWEWSDRRFIHCTQAELAMVLNTYRESMTVLLHTLQRRGLIRLHYRRIEIVSLYGLRQLAEDY